MERLLMRPAILPAHNLTETPSPARTGGSRRSRFLRTLRKLHGWIGLWGALLGLLFGFTGIVLNHRAVLKLPLAATREETVQIPVAEPVPADAAAMAQWLRNSLKLPDSEPRIRKEPAHPVAWGEQAVVQPAHWQIGFATPQLNIQADYWVGSKMVSVRRAEGNFFAVLNNLHKGTGLGIAWVLLVDSIGGSLILLSLTGVVLWVQLHKRLAPFLLLGGSSLGLAIWLMLA
jgi:hypothetical protein